MSGPVVRHARVYRASLPLSQPFRIAGGAMLARESWIVALDDGEGNVGFGESAPFRAPFYSPETLAGAKEALVSWLIPRVLGTDVGDPAQVRDRLAEDIRGHQMARAGVETACWDLRAARLGAPPTDLVTERLAQLAVPDDWLRRLEVVTCGVALGIPEGRDVETVRSWTEAAIARGYQRIKLKICPGWDVAPVQAVREVLEDWGEDLPVTVDANGAYHLERDLAVLEQLDELGLLYIEQPFAADALWDLAELTHALATPVCLDETLTSDDVARQVVTMDGPDVWNVKVQRVGGLEEACRIYARAAQSGAKLWLGTMPETGVGAQAGLALGAHAGFVYPSDLEPSGRWYAGGQDLIELDMDGDGRMPVPRRRRVPDVSLLELVHESSG